MCDYSLTHVKSRPAVVGETLVTASFATGTSGFRGEAKEEKDVAVCLLPGTELAFEKPVTHRPRNPYGTYTEEVESSHKTARFRQINKETRIVHHDALEFPDGETVLLTLLAPDQHAKVLQLPAAPKTEKEAEEQKRVEFIG
jgi:hypothetical protein